MSGNTYTALNAQCVRVTTLPSTATMSALFAAGCATMASTTITNLITEIDGLLSVSLFVLVLLVVVVLVSLVVVVSGLAGLIGLEGLAGLTLQRATTAQGVYKNRAQ